MTEAFAPMGEEPIEIREDSDVPDLESNSERSERVFATLRTHKAMPLLEIAAATGVRGDYLAQTVEDLQKQDLVTVTGHDPFEMIVSVSGKYY